MPPAATGDRAQHSRLVRVACAVVGTVALGLGLVGLVIPVLPTTPFLLLAAACYARASERLYTWLIGQRALGPIVTQWRQSRSVQPGVKTRALIMVVITFGASLLLVDSLLLRLVLVITAVILLAFLARIPTRS
jgi:hypothetical protein